MLRFWLQPLDLNQPLLFLISRILFDFLKLFHLVVNCYYASGPGSYIHIKFQVEIDSADDKQTPGINQPPVADTIPASDQSTPAISAPQKNNDVPETKDPVISGAPNQNPPEVVPPPAEPTPTPAEPTPTPAASGEQSEIEQMVLSQLKATPAACATTAPAANGVGQGVEKVNWSTHKNEGMRLTRFVESNSAQFPHMAQMFESGNKKEWVFRFEIVPYKLMFG